MTKARRHPIDEPPERYQTLALTLTVGLAYLPLGRFLDWQVSAFVALVVLLRLASLRWLAALPGRWVLLLLTLVGVANCLQANHSLVGKSGGAALLVTMLALKLLELRSRRDHRVAAIVVGPLIVVQFLFDQGMPLTLVLAAVALVMVGLLVDLNGGLGLPAARRVSGVTLRIALQAVPLTLVLFLLFPRLSAPLWSLGVEPDQATTGMSESMEPGSISELVVNGELAFRARFDGPAPPLAQLYWRGLVLWQVDDRRWSPGPGPLAWGGKPELAVAQDPIDYEVLLEPSDRRWMFALDLPTTQPADTELRGDFQLLANRPITSTKRYRLRSALNYQTAPIGAAERRSALRVPPNVTGRMRSLVDQWSKGARSDWDLVQAGLTFFNREEFRYTLLPPRLGVNPWDEFLFESRSGFCEHYAGSFAVLMRLGGLPSRVVLGYLGGEPNRIGGYHMIWQSDAHAWTEVLIAGRGWVRVDPTSAVAPSRVDNRGASRLLGANAPARFQIAADSLLARTARQLRNLADSLDATWQGWVLDFSSARQEELLDLLGLRNYGAFALAGIMVTAVSIVMGLILLGLMRQTGSSDPAARSYARFCRRLAAVGLARRADEGPRDFARRIGRVRPDLAADIEEIVSAYVRNRYMPAPTDQDLQTLARRVKAFWPTRHRRRNPVS